MKKIFTSMAMMAALLVMASGVQAQEELIVDGSESYYNYLIKGTDYILPGTDADWYCQPGFFTHNEGDVWTFQAYGDANMAYCIVLDENLKYVYVTVFNAEAGEGVDIASPATWDNNRALWVNGSAGIGFPSFSTNAINWGGNQDVAVPMVDEGVYQLTLVVGQQISANDVNFKFFKGKNWGGDVDGSMVWMEENDYLYLGGQEGASGDNGNIYLKDGVQIGDLDTLTLTIDMNNKEYGLEGTITVKYDMYTPASVPSLNGVELTKSGNYFYRNMTLAQGDELTLTGADLIDMDIAMTYVDDMALTALGDGKYKVNVVGGDYSVVLIPYLNYIKLVPGTFENPGTWESCRALWIIGTGIGQPSIDINDSGWNPVFLSSIPVAQVEENLYKINLTVGRELSADFDFNFKFFGQYGWGWEFIKERLVMEENEFMYMTMPECVLIYDENGALSVYHGTYDGDIWPNGNKLAVGDKVTLTIDMREYSDYTYDEENWLIVSHPGTITVDYTPNDLLKPTFDGVEMKGSGKWFYLDAQLEQGKTYTMVYPTDMDFAGLYADPCFVTNHGDGTFTFNAISGSYCFMINTEDNFIRVNPGTFDAPASIADGGLWVIGEGFGRPSVNTHPINWHTGSLVAWPVAQTRPGIFQMDLMCDTEMWDNWCNYKFFGQPNYDIEFVPNTDYSIVSDEGNVWLNVGSSDGNITFMNGAYFVKGEPIYIVIDFTAGFDHGVMYVSTEPIIDNNVGVLRADESHGEIYTIKGIHVDAATQPGFYLRGGRVFMVR